MFGWLKRRDTPSPETVALVAVTTVLQQFLSLHQSWSEKMLALETEKVRLETLRLEGAKPLDVPMGNLRVSEDEQDADWALQQGLISTDEYNDLMYKVGLSPSDLEFM